MQLNRAITCMLDTLTLELIMDEITRDDYVRK